MTERVEDPTHTRYTVDSYTNSVLHRLNNIEGSLLAHEGAELLGMSSLMLEGWQEWWFDELPRHTNWSIMRGIDYAASTVNRLGPDFQAGSGWLPIDTVFREEALELQQGYISNLTNEMKTRIQDMIERKLSTEQMVEQLHTDFNFARTRAEQIARSELLRHFNTTTRLRYQAWGIKRYRFIAHIDACTVPKKLRNGIIVRGGCTELHDQVFPIEDDFHCPPIHTNGRCTIIPELEND